MDDLPTGEDVVNELDRKVEQFWMGSAVDFEEGPVDGDFWRDLIFGVDILMKIVIKR